jgi:hypothetical protein
MPELDPLQAVVKRGRLTTPLIGRVVVIDLPNAVAMSYTVVAHGLMPAGPNCGVKEVARMAGTSPASV